MEKTQSKEITGFIYFVFAYARSHYGDTQHDNGTVINAVKILTIHKAKGLEFPVVFLPKFVQKENHDHKIILQILNFMILKGIMEMMKIEGDSTIQQ